MRPIQHQMKRLVALACAAAALALPACGGNDTAASTPTPAPSYRPGEAPAYQNGGSILGPGGKARNTVDQLDQIQQQREQDSGGGAYSPTEP
jgi:hypothetical protein